MTTLRHVMILASAGSGKTYALTNRFVELLAAGAAPEKIVALTFTRKAAGEFFDEILHKLASAATTDREAQRLAVAIGAPTLGRRDFLRMLRLVVDAMPRLRLGTIDGFFAGIARAFPLELGLAGEFEILQEHAARVERQRILRRMFGRSGTALDAAQSEFIEAFKRATFGADEKRLGARLDAFLDAHQEKFLAAPEAALWGDPARIWPTGSPWLASEIKIADAVRELRGLLGPLTDGQRVRWENFFAALEEWTPGAPLPGPLEYILKNALAVWSDVCSGNAAITIERRKLVLPPGGCRALERIITHVVGAELHRRIETTRGIFAVLHGYEAHYHEAVRRAGKLTFADVQRLLDPNVGAPRLAGGVNREAAPDAESETELTLSLDESREERRLMLDYRLDAEIDHWLLDEFQDTSFGQWSVLKNLVDEVVQDAEGRRSFFCVGDVKQAIYAWREGDPRLFREIFNHYNAAAPGAIEERRLDDSWRSGPAVVEMVNAVFGAEATLAELFPGPASQAWNREWRAHRSALPDRHGQAALLHAADEAGRWAATRALIEEIRPLERGLTCAVLVKRNDTGAALADYLRHAGIAAIAESDLHIATDNPLGAALLALLQAAAHPGDTLAQRHVEMTPLAAVLRANAITTPEALTRRVLEQIHEDSFERTVEFWIAQLEPRLSPADAFSRVRGREFAAAAGLFDATGSRDVAEFIAFMECYTIRPPESASVVRVMTVHKSKGLGFDVVLVPDLQGNRIDERREGLAVQKSADRAVEWVLDLPPKLFYTQDKVLAAHVSAAEAEACYENLSLLYVALTRAKRGLYVVTEPVGDSQSRNFPRLLAETLGTEAQSIRVGGAMFEGTWSCGDPDWYRPLSRAGSADATRPVALSPVPDETRFRSVRRVARRPSRPTELPDRVRRAGMWFALEAGAAAEFGTALHALLAEVEWAVHSDGESWAARWRQRGAIDAEVIASAADALRAPDLAKVWMRPRGAQSEVWRERAFEVILDEAWVTGVFDRVVVVRGPDGRIERATVFDFKTDRVVGANDIAAAVARYRPQLELYRRVAAMLTGLSEREVGCELVFISVLRCVPVPAQPA